MPEAAGTVSNSQVIHDASGQKALPTVRSPATASSINASRRRRQLKALKDFTLIGKPLKRKDTPEQSRTASAKYGIDVDAGRRSVRGGCRVALSLAARSVRWTIAGAMKLYAASSKVIVLDDPGRRGRRHDVERNERPRSARHHMG